MKYQDQIFGEVEITEPVILKLMKTPEMQRLKAVNQAGYPQPFFGWEHYSRFDHSLGVFLLLREFGAPLPEQVAGLIHDVNHTVFSHCADYALSEGSETEQNFQDNTFAAYVRNSSLALIIKKAGLDLEFILDERNFPMLEREIPDLCADRLEYTLREMTNNGTGLDLERGVRPGNIKPIERRRQVRKILDSLEIRDDFWVFRDYAAGKKFARIFLKINHELYSGFKSIVMFKTVGDCLRHAFLRKYLNRDDLYLTDEQVLAKIEAQVKRDTELGLFWERMNNRIKGVNDKKNYEARVCCKSRVVDPWCWHRGQRRRISEIDPQWKETVRDELKPKEYFLRFER